MKGQYMKNFLRTHFVLFLLCAAFQSQNAHSEQLLGRQNSDLTCSQREAQFLAKIDRIEYVNHAENRHCKIYLKFEFENGDFFGEHKRCPLTLHEAINLPIQAGPCFYDEYKENQTLSGVLVRVENNSFLSLD